jgi:hypothetical protein
VLLSENTLPEPRPDKQNDADRQYILWQSLDNCDYQLQNEVASDLEKNKYHEVTPGHFSFCLKNQ